MFPHLRGRVGSIKLFSSVLFVALNFRNAAKSTREQTTPNSALERTSARHAGRLSCTSSERAESAQFETLAIMILRYIDIALRAYRPGLEVLPETDFLDLVRLRPGDERVRVESSEHRGQAARVVFATAAGEVIPGEYLAARFEGAADWITERAKDLRLLQETLLIDVFVDAGIEGDSFEIHVPSAFLTACSTSQLPLIVSTHNYHIDLESPTPHTGGKDG
jgi:hypothetical protein